MLIEERDHRVIENVGRGQRRLAGVGLREAQLGVGVDYRLLADAADPFQGFDVESVLRQAVARVLAGCSTAIATTAGSTSGAARFFRLGLARVISASARSPPSSYRSRKR
jgi:hypothetical protein